MNEHAKEIIDALLEAVNEIPHQQISPEVLKLMLAAASARALLKIKFDK